MSGVPASVLDGVPLVVKGNFLLKDVPMNTACTQLLRQHVPAHCAALVIAFRSICFRSPSHCIVAVPLKCRDAVAWYCVGISMAAIIADTCNMLNWVPGAQALRSRLCLCGKDSNE